ncbi:MAG: hypothetical protein HYS05_06060 [Acidobacteria bacterium]|nr:hypothetical protein [Acidobacteriota bacterium]
MHEVERPNVRAELLRLKNFQRDTVEHVFEAMYRPTNPVRRFLVADEVGLGKTLVARGIVAKVIDRLWDTVKRIDIVYICSNGSIARQNINRLNVMDAKEASLPSRITLLPKFVHGLERRKLNFVSLTPQTSFNLRSNLGTAEERALLYWLLPDDWKLRDAGARNALQGGVERRERFRARVEDAAHDEVDASLREAFRQQLQSVSDLNSAFAQLCERFAYSRTVIPDDDRTLQRRTIGRLRLELAHSCLRALEQDLIILDEFQRFKHLLDGTDQASDLARRLFAFGDARVLLLSATPYKMYTTSGETKGDEHFRDFLQTVGFLHNDASKTEQFKTYLGEYRAELFRLNASAEDGLRLCKAAVERELKQVMVRTERLAVTPDRNGMLAEVRPAPMTIDRGDLTSYVALARVARALDHHDIIEYWKSAPYLLNFMDDYELKEAFKEAVGIPGRCKELRQNLSGVGEALLSWDDIERYRKLDPRNAPLRHLMADVVDSGTWRLLWMPPALPYYKVGVPFADFDADRFTKRLVFSSWKVVPKVVAALLSYEVERRMFGHDSASDERPNTPEGRARHTALLQFTRSSDRPANLSLLGLLYPSMTLAAAGDPLRFVSHEGAAPPTEAEVLSLVEGQLRRLLDELPKSGERSGQPDETWYWAAPILLDLQLHPQTAKNWLGQDSLAEVWRGDEAREDEEDCTARVTEGDAEGQDAWSDHVDEARRLAVKSLKLGPQPQDLCAVLARLAVGGPAVVALRALSRISGGASALERPYLRNKAGWIAWGFRSLFNLPEVAALIRSMNDQEPYWLRVAEYCVAGGLQAVLDEYVHMLLEWEGVAHRPPREAARAVAKRIAQALQLRAANVGVDAIAVNADEITLTDKRMRARFAARFGARQSDEGAGAVRQDDVRAAFNSPFWPFVLCSTSVGQEGLDFHLYCHAVVHWNLPSNPVDLEQREGRVHRYKGHAVRKNAARLYGSRSGARSARPLCRSS